jgi:hypothetical protein
MGMQNHGNTMKVVVWKRYILDIQNCQSLSVYRSSARDKPHNMLHFKNPIRDMQPMGVLISNS